MTSDDKMSLFHKKKTPTVFSCKNCDYNTYKKSDLIKHFLTRKHKVNDKLATINAILEAKIANGQTLKNHLFECHCGKQYKYRQGLFVHKKKCIKLDELKNKEEESKKLEEIKKREEDKLDNTIILELLKQNQEFKQQIIDFIRKDMNTTNINTINNTTNKFNMNFFLNEQCKGALDIMDFIASLNVQLEDLENTGKIGYVNGITNIFLRNLKELDVYKRPIHCSDLKREVMYVKDKNVWEKDEEKNKMKLAIRHITDKNFKQLNEWIQKNPDAKDIETKKHDQYMKILSKCTGGIDLAEDDLYFKKIISNVAKEVQIEKQYKIL
jgi:hypothetical protein